MIDKLINLLLFFITNNLKVWVIPVDGKPYNERYRIGKCLGKTYYLHHYVTCDGERWLHDHPWPWAISFVLSGGYVEERFQYLDPSKGIVTTFNHVGCLNLLFARDLHRIHEIEANTWTLFIVPENVKGRGFIDEIPGPKIGGPKRFIYEQPYTGERTEDFMSDCPTAAEYRYQQMLKKQSIFYLGTGS